MFESISNFFNKPKQENIKSSGFQYSWNNGPFASTTEAAGFPPKKATSTPSISSLYTPPPAPIIRKVDPKKIPEAIRYLESNKGLDPNTPRNQRRVMNIPAANQNEKPRTVAYDIGFGGEYGLTPDALAELAKSKIDREATPDKFTKFGRPLIPGRAPEEIQKLLMTPEGAGQLANEYFMMMREKKDSFTPEDLANDYVDYYVGKGMINDTPKNRKRALDYFNSLID